MYCNIYPTIQLKMENCSLLRKCI